MKPIKKNKKKSAIWFIIGILLMYFSISTGKASIGEEGLLSLLNVSQRIGQILFFGNLLLIIVALILGLLYLPKPKETA
ncbi:MAG: hypothetical protein NT085_04875 [candidate division SR1 bacterium]|nr:hypothetical protein [candidate division SR1 bacterium]